MLRKLSQNQITMLLRTYTLFQDSKTVVECLGLMASTKDLLQQFKFIDFVCIACLQIQNYSRAPFVLRSIVIKVCKLSIWVNNNVIHLWYCNRGFLSHLRA